MKRREWLEMMVPSAVRNLRDGIGFGVSARDHLMWSFDGSYRVGRHAGDATRYEIGPRAWFLIEEVTP